MDYVALEDNTWDIPKAAGLCHRAQATKGSTGNLTALASAAHT